MVKQSAPDWLRDYADENRLFHCTEVSVLYLVVEKPLSLTSMKQRARTRGAAVASLSWWLRRSRAAAETSGDT